MLIALHGLDSPEQAIERLVYAVVAENLIRRADRLKLGQRGAEFALAHQALPRENRSHSSELKVQRQHLVRKAANRLDQINYNFSLLTVDRHGNFPIANRPHSRGARPYRTLSNMNASDG
jgi:hypothetical protein